MHKQMLNVQAFHNRLQVSHKRDFFHGQPCDNLKDFGLSLISFSKALEPEVNEDTRVLRAHLLIEEVGEFVLALEKGDEHEALDALTDLLYVLIGTAVTFDWPLSEAFDEVHRSNMTKEKQPTDPSAARVRQKGPNYSPPDIKGILQAYRSR